VNKKKLVNQHMCREKYQQQLIINKVLETLIK